MQPITMTTAEKVKIRVTILDQGSPPVPITTMPEGSSVVFESSNLEAVTIEPVEDDPFACYLRSPNVGLSTVTVTGTGEFASLPPDSGPVEVRNSQPGSFNTTVGAPEPE